MFNSRFLKDTSYAVLSASVASVVHSASGFAKVELNNKQKESEVFNGENVLLPPKQKGLRLDDVGFADERKCLYILGDAENRKMNDVCSADEKKDRKIWPLFVFGIPAIMILFGGYTYFKFIKPHGIGFSYFKFIWGIFHLGNEKFQNLSFVEKCVLADRVLYGSFSVVLCCGKIGKDEGDALSFVDSFNRLKDLCEGYFGTKEILSLVGLDFEVISKMVKFCEEKSEDLKHFFEHGTGKFQKLCFLDKCTKAVGAMEKVKELSEYVVHGVLQSSERLEEVVSLFNDINKSFGEYFCIKEIYRLFSMYYDDVVQIIDISKSRLENFESIKASKK